MYHRVAAAPSSLWRDVARDQVATQLLIERAKAVGGGIHSALIRMIGGEKVVLGPWERPELDDDRQVLTGLGFNSATVPACRTTFDCQG